MSGKVCLSCGNRNPPDGHYCARCGAQLFGPDPPDARGRRYSALRFQVDPLEPTPRRDPRWVMIAVGLALAILGGLLLVVSAVVSFAVSAGATPCPTSSCGTFDPSPWFVWSGLGVLLVGAILLALGLWFGLRR